MKKEDGGSAFPEGGNNINSGNWEIFGGMSLRDYFATRANEEDIRCIISKMKYEGNKDLIQRRCEAKYIYADTMIAERNK